MRMRDTSCLIQFYKRFCSDIQQWLFIDIYEHCVAKQLGYLIVDFVSHKYKYRVNSLNHYFDTESMKIECINCSFKSDGREQANSQLQRKFLNTINKLKRGKQYGNIEMPSSPTVSWGNEKGQTKLNMGKAKNLEIKTAPRNTCTICNEDYYNTDALSLPYSLDHITEEGDEADKDSDYDL